MTKEEAKNIFNEYHTYEVIDYDYVIELVAKYCNKKEQIDEDKLDELSDNYYFNEEMESSGEFERIKNAYEAGYHKAKEE